MRILNSYLFSDNLKSGVFRTLSSDTLSELRKQSEANDYQYIELDGFQITSKNEILDMLDDVLSPPEPIMFKRHWDAFASELNSLEWISYSGIVIVYKDFQVFQKTNPKDFAIFTDIIYLTVHRKIHFAPMFDMTYLYFVFHSEDEDLLLPPMQLSVPYLMTRR